MKIKNIQQVEEFLAAVKKCEGGVKLTSRFGDVYNLKSQLSQYIAISALLGSHGEELELFLDEQIDERHFFKFFQNHPEVMG